MNKYFTVVHKKTGDKFIPTKTKYPFMSDDGKFYIMIVDGWNGNYTIPLPEGWEVNINHNLLEIKGLT